MEKLRVHILRKLFRHTYIGRRHMSVTDLQQGLPKEKRVMKDIEEVVRGLVNEGYLIPHKKRQEGFYQSQNVKRNKRKNTVTEIKPTSPASSASQSFPFLFFNTDDYYITSG